MISKYSGYIAATVTPFKNNKIDMESLEKYINYLSNSSIESVVLCGSTAESLALSESEKIDIIQKSASIIKGRKKIICGIIDSTTESCKNFMKKTENIVDAFLCICPFYLKPSQEQIYNHYNQLALNTEKDIILYNNPSRVGTSIGFDLLLKLSQIENIVGLKECSADISVFAKMKNVFKNNFSILSGNDDTAAGALAMGASGVISVSANIIPEQSQNMYHSLNFGNIEQFQKILFASSKLHELLFKEPSPAPLKYLLSKIGLMENQLRNPLSSINKDLEQEINICFENFSNTFNGVF